MRSRTTSQMICLIGLGLVVTAAIMAQSAVTLTPENPKWGDTLVVKYNSAAGPAKLRGESELFLVYFVDYPEYSERHWARMKKEGAAFTAPLKISEPAAVYSFHFCTKEQYDGGASTTAYVSTREGKPARGAAAFKVNNADENYRKYFSEEIGLYPDNYVAYRNKWSIDSDLRRVRKGVVEGLRLEVHDLRKKINNDTPSLLYALAFGYLAIGQEPEARAAIKQLAEKFGKAPLIERAIADYEHHTNTMQLAVEQGLAEMQAIRVNLADQNPDSALARQLLRGSSGDTSIRLELLEKIAQGWMKAETDNPVPAMVLGEVYAARNVQSAKSRELLTKAINLTLDGFFRLYEDTSGYFFQTHLPRLYRTRAEVNLRSKQYASALADINAAADLGQPQRAYYYEYRGQIWEAMKYPSRAEEDYILAYVTGNSQAREPLRALYRKRHGSDKGFQDYLDKKRAEHRPRTAALPAMPAAGKPPTPKPKSR